jgi:hypothetical protein
MRMNAFDGVPFGCDFETPYPYGWGVDAANPLREDLREVKQAIACFREWGVELLNISLGSPYYNPHIGRPFEKPDEGNYEQPEHPLIGVDRHFRIAAELQRAFPDLPIVGTGYSWLQKYAINAGAHNIAAGDIHFLGRARRAGLSGFRARRPGERRTGRAPLLQDADVLHLSDAAEESSAGTVSDRMSRPLADAQGGLWRRIVSGVLWRRALAGEGRFKPNRLQQHLQMR